MSDETSPHEKAIDAGLLLPGQYADLVRRNHVIEGELKLLLAVLEDAIRCYLRNVEREGRRAPPRIRRGQELVRRQQGAAPARRYFQLRKSLRGARHRAAVLLDAPADSDDRRSSIAALPDAPASPAVEPAACQRSAPTRCRALSRHVTAAPSVRFELPSRRAALKFPRRRVDGDHLARTHGENRSHVEHRLGLQIPLVLWIVSFDESAGSSPHR